VSEKIARGCRSERNQNVAAEALRPAVVDRTKTVRVGSFAFEGAKERAVDPLRFCDHLFVIPSEVEESLTISETSRDVSTSVDMTEAGDEQIVIDALSLGDVQFFVCRSMEKVTVRIPASTSNLGPGFDCLGVALRIYNRVIVSRTTKRKPLAPIAAKAADRFFKRTKQRRFAFSCSATEKIPRSRGLGSSATIRLGILQGLNELTRRPLDRLSIFRLCAELEGHPDNAAPSSFGGFTVARGKNVQRFQVSPRLKFVLLIPAFEIRTLAARKILPEEIPHTDAVASAGNACAITAAFASGEYENLRGAFIDQFHQPFRARLIPFLPRVVAAAEEAGALGAFLSGSGSTICAVTLQNARKVAAAMLRAAKTTAARTLITTADNQGVQIRSQQSAIKN
jgi:homoserine kinase